MTIEADTLLIQVRDELRDTREPFLVSDTQIYRALTAAQNTLARTALCFTSAGELSYTVAANKGWVDVAPEIIRPRHIQVRGTDHIVEPTISTEINDLLVSSDYGRLTTLNWRVETDTVPRFAVTDMAFNRWRLVPIPTTEITLDVEAWVYAPPIEAGGDSPLAAQTSEGLVHGAITLLLMMPDVDMYDGNKSEYHNMQWLTYLSLMQSDTKSHTRPSRLTRQRKGYW